MFRVYTINENSLPIVVLQNEDNSTSAKISLNEGGRLQELKCNNICVLKDIKDFDYKISYASSVLFPFVSRIKDGKYTFLDEDFQFKKNDNNTSALHGLVYDKSFQVFENETHQNYCTVTLNYIENIKNTGFPYKYFISLTYTLYENSLKLNVTIKNLDDQSFPFTLGWHPYFLSDDLAKSTLRFKSDKKVVFDENLITKKVIKNKEDEMITLAKKQLDDCFFLEDNKVSFSTPKFNLQILSSEKENYLQLYTPKDLPIIAIEPMTGISDSFNNQIGLQVLKPKQTHSITWTLDIQTK